jgi:hypothetical protein
MLYLTIASLIVMVIATGYAVKQTAIAKAMKDEQDDEQTEVRDWQVRHEVVAIKLSKINPHFQVRYPIDDATRIIYTELFPDSAFRRAVELYIVEVDRTLTVFAPRKPTPHELRSPALRETVKAVEARLADFCDKNPAIADIFRT